MIDYFAFYEIYTYWLNLFSKIGTAQTMIFFQVVFRKKLHEIAKIAYFCLEIREILQKWPKLTIFFARFARKLHKFHF